MIAAVKKTIAAGNDRDAQGDPARSPQNPGALAKTGTRPDEPPRRLGQCRSCHGFGAGGSSLRRLCPF